MSGAIWYVEQHACHLLIDLTGRVRMCWLQDATLKSPFMGPCGAPIFQRACVRFSYLATEGMDACIYSICMQQGCDVERREAEPM